MRYVLAQVTAQPVAEPDPWDPDIAALLRMSSFSRYTSLVLGRIAVPRTYVDAAHCYRRSSVVCRSVTIGTDGDAVSSVDSGGPKEPCIRWGRDPPREGTFLRGKRGGRL